MFQAMPEEKVLNPVCEPGKATLPISWLMENLLLIAISGKMRFHLNPMCLCMQKAKEKIPGLLMISFQAGEM